MATQHKTPFSVHKKDVILVKPTQAIPSQILSLSTMDNNYHLELHCQSIFVYEANPHATTDPASVIKEALSRLLVYYYPLAGKIKRYDDGKLRITYNPHDDLFGVPFLEATADCELSALHYFEEHIDANDTRSLFFEYSPTKGSDVDGYYHPLVMQVTKFACGGFTFSLGLLHSAADGVANIQFLQALGELASGKSKLSVEPVWERERLQGTASQDPFTFPEENPPLVTSPFLPSSEMVHEWFNIEAESINGLRTLCLPKKNGLDVVNEPTLTSFEVLCAYIWRARFRALEQNLDGKVGLMLIMGVNHVIKNPPLPQGYYGNVIVASNAGITGKELNDQGSLRDVAKVVKECKKMGSNIDFVKWSLDFLETVMHQKLSIVVGGSTMIVTDCRQLGWCEISDFGWKKPVNHFILPWSMIGHHDNVVMLAPNYKRGSTTNNGVRILISLPKDAMPKFKEEMVALGKLNRDD